MNPFTIKTSVKEGSNYPILVDQKPDKPIQRYFEILNEEFGGHLSRPLPSTREWLHFDTLDWICAETELHETEFKELPENVKNDFELTKSNFIKAQNELRTSGDKYKVFEYFLHSLEDGMEHIRFYINGSSWFLVNWGMFSEPIYVPKTSPPIYIPPSDEIETPIENPIETPFEIPIEADPSPLNDPVEEYDTDIPNIFRKPEHQTDGEGINTGIEDDTGEGVDEDQIKKGPEDESSYWDWLKWVLLVLLILFIVYWFSGGSFWAASGPERLKTNTFGSKTSTTGQNPKPKLSSKKDQDNSTSTKPPTSEQDGSEKSSKAQTIQGSNPRGQAADKKQLTNNKQESNTGNRNRSDGQASNETPKPLSAGFASPKKMADSQKKHLGGMNPQANESNVSPPTDPDNITLIGEVLMYTDEEVVVYYFQEKESGEKYILDIEELKSDNSREHEISKYGRGTAS